MDIKFNDTVENQLMELKKYKKNSLKWEMKYYDLYDLIHYRIVNFCKSNAIKIQNEQNLRVDIDEYCSVALTEVLMKLVEDFDPYTDKGFMNLYYYRIKKAFINLYKKELTKNKKALTTSIEWKSSYDNNCVYIKDEQGDDIYKIVDDYIKINPKARIIYLYDIENRERRRAEILKILGKKEYGNATGPWVDMMVFNEDGANFGANPKVRGNKIYHVGNKPNKSDIGLGNVNNWGASTAVNNTSTTTYATASAVKQAYDKANHSHPYVSTSGFSTVINDGSCIYFQPEKSGGAIYLTGRHTDKVNKWYVGSPNANYNLHLRSVGGAIIARGSYIGCRNTDDNGYVECRASKFAVSSEEKWKENIEEFNKNAINIINSSKIYEYDLKDELDNYKEKANADRNKSIGLVIDRETPKEILLDMPTEVTSADGKIYTEIDKGIDIYSMVSLSWKAIQEQQILIDKLNQEIILLKSKLL